MRSCGLTFFLTAHHPVSVVSIQIPVCAESEAVSRPLQNSGFVDNIAREGDGVTDCGSLVVGCSSELLLE